MFWYRLADQWAFLGNTWSTIDNLIQDPGGQVFVRLSGTGQFAGPPSNVINYSYQEGSTPLIPGDESGAIGDISIDVLDESNTSILLYKDEFYLQDNVNGAIIGEVEAVSGNNDITTMGGRSILSRTNVDAVIPPRRDTIGNIIEAVLNSVGIQQNIIKETSLSTTLVNAPGYEGDVWVYLKDLCSAYVVEMSVVREYVIIRPARERKIDAINILERSWQLQDIELAQFFDVAYYNYSQVEDFLVYPKGGWTEDVQVYQVGANETTTFDIPIEFFLTSVNQPTVQSNVAKDYAGPASVYAVSGNDGLPITPAQWTDQGGDMSFAIKGDGTIIEVTLTGPDFPELAPFTIGLNDGSSSYSTLRITGDGMNFNKQVYTEKTGLTANNTPVVNAGEIDNPAIDTLADAKRYALFARHIYSSPTQTFTTSARSFPRLSGALPTVLYPSFADFNDTLPAGYAFTNFNSEYAGLTFEDFTVQLSNAVPQGFGEVVGSRVRLDDAVYRVRNATITPDQISIDAEYDTLFNDLDDVYGAALWSELAQSWGSLGATWSDILFVGFSEKTFNDFNSYFENVNFSDFALIPMRDRPSVLT